MEYFAYILAVAAFAVLLFMLLGLQKKLEVLQRRLDDADKASSEEKERGITILARQDLLVQRTENALEKIGRQMADSALQTEQKLENLRRTQAESLERLQNANTVQLENIRKTVDDKLQETLDKKLTDSFKMVSERLEQVYKGLGEMQNLASGVGDLKKVLSNVKTRGVLGEIQLGAILEQILAPEQYAANVATKRGSRDNVEYAIRLPGNDGNSVWIPVDAKFPLDAYEQLLSAYDSADPQQVDAALKTIKTRVRAFAKDIQTKYIDPPNTTEFGIMFIPTEGLYAELVRAGMIESLQNDFKVTISGPTTMSALLNSLQMGFRTLAIQKRSSQVWEILSSVKKEFGNFAAVLESAQKRIHQVGADLDTLSGVRTRQIQRALKDVETLPDEQDKLEESTGV
ncbi:MAG: DNA recombination protein RmuC [Clostridiaceae bacterium]|nr:DNA recombination protein RmuC [Clostridiaceae bacterium]